MSFQHHFSKEPALFIGPKSQFRELSLRGNRSNLAFFNEIATHLLGARNDRMGKGGWFLNRDLGPFRLVKDEMCQMRRKDDPQGENIF